MNLNKHEIDKAYVSEHDVFLHQFDKDHPEKSASQEKEIAKHQKLHALRDGVEVPAKVSLLKKVFRVVWG
tara:strand:+ start:182 stop:391 length:210 start_codon:yes stop_codon:yes gene_type:complete